MSFSAVRPYFRSIGVAEDFTEWPDGFNFENIPETLLDRAFHIGPIEVVPDSLNQLDQEMVVEITIRLFHKGFRDPASALDTSAVDSEDFIKAAMANQTRLDAGSICNVRVASMEQVEIALSNDNAVRTDISFNCDVILEL